MRTDQFREGYDAGHADGYNEGRTDRIGHEDLLLASAFRKILTCSAVDYIAAGKRTGASGEWWGATIDAGACPLTQEECEAIVRVRPDAAP